MFSNLLQQIHQLVKSTWETCVKFAGKLLPRLDEEEEFDEEEEDLDEIERAEEEDDEEEYTNEANNSMTVEYHSDTPNDESCNSETGELEPPVLKQEVFAFTSNVNKPSQSTSEFQEQIIPDIKPDVSEIKPNSRDTLSYLKAKRINRHKSGDVVCVKRFKSSNVADES